MTTDEGILTESGVIHNEIDRAISLLEEAMSGTSPKSKNTLIKEAIKILK